jgi:Cytochrome C biogenesis protein transmembrane region
MLASINPLGERARQTRWGRTVAWYLAGSTAGGLTIGAIAGLLGAALHRASPSPTLLGFLAVSACLVGLALDVGFVGAHRPTVHRQVNQDWLTRYRGWVYGGGFGFQLGLGVVTVVNTSTIYVAFALAVLAGSVGAGLLIGGVFGFVRALPMLIVGRAHEPARMRTIMGRVHRWSGAAAAAALASLVLVAAVGVATLVG